MKRRTSKSPRGFTLIEMLVVMVIVALLASILTVAMTKAIGSARKATCKANLRELHGIAATYMDQHNQVFPSLFWMELAMTNWISYTNNFPIEGLIGHGEHLEGQTQHWYQVMYELAEENRVCPFDERGTNEYLRFSYVDGSTNSFRRLTYSTVASETALYVDAHDHEYEHSDESRHVVYLDGRVNEL